MTPTLEQYLSEGLDRGITDHTIRVNRNEAGKIAVYIRPTRVGGPRLDYTVEADKLIPKTN